MARTVSDPTLARVQMLLGAGTLADLDAIAREFVRRTGRYGNRTVAVRWAVAELRARLELERKSRGQATLTRPGPLAPPPE